MSKVHKVYTEVRPKKFLGQHFLTDETTAQRITDALVLPDEVKDVLEIGPGMGVLTRYLVERDFNLHLVELDSESVVYIKEHFPELQHHITEQDVLQMDFNALPQLLAVIGNFPYNISSQILFKVLEHKEQVLIVVGMFQKEVAQRITSAPGSKDYGILSVLLQAWYDCEYLFTVDAAQFHPAPKVQSGVIRLTRIDRKKLKCSEDIFKKVIKQAFNQRRKTLRNSLRSMVSAELLDGLPYASFRPEQLDWKQFEELTCYIYKC
jgi:16S rRNA (adenine1518-N6/adenine1519-N6)-dimethyltransferase